MDVSLILNAINDYSGAIGASTGIVVAAVGLVNLRHLRNDSKIRSRPYVFVQRVPGLHGPGTWDLKVSNLGASIATGILLKIAPEWEAADEGDTHTQALKEALRIPMSLPPNSHVRLLWRIDRKGDHGRVERAGAPSNAHVTATYYGNVDRKSRREGYSETFQVRTDQAIAMPAPTEGSKVNGKEDGNELKNIYRALRTLNSHVGELRR